MANRDLGTWLDRAIGYWSPAAGLRRLRARTAGALLERNYDAASIGRRTQGWRRGGGDANAVTGPAASIIRDRARDLVRNNGYAESALQTIVDHVVGWGIVAKPSPPTSRAAELWAAWSGSTACDAEGRADFAGLQKLVLRTVAESGECLVRRRLRLPEDGLPIPLQLQLLEPDYLDSAKTHTLATGGRIINGVEYDPIGRRAAYWLFPEHPGALLPSAAASQRVPAESVLHVFRQDRPGQARGMSWLAPVLLRFKDFDDFADATLMKQRIAACLAVMVTDPGGDGAPLGITTTENPQIDSLEPGAILRGTGTVEVIQPPSVREYADYTRTTLREIATGLGCSYEDLTGDYSSTNFSSARMARLRHWARVEDWRWRMLVPQLCAPVWTWAMEAAAMASATTRLSGLPGATWTAPPMPMIEPAQEGLAYQRLIRSGLMSLSEAIRERGYDPAELMREMAADNAELDKLGLVLDSDARATTQAGNPRDLGAVSGASSGDAAADPTA